MSWIGPGGKNALTDLVCQINDALCAIIKTEAHLMVEENFNVNNLLHWWNRPTERLA